jgi:hypothetical protein
MGGVVILFVREGRGSRGGVKVTCLGTDLLVAARGSVYLRRKREMAYGKL